MSRNKSYRELRRYPTFEERFEYLSFSSVVGTAVAEVDRWLNQRFYTSREWKQVRQSIIARDMGCDLGVEGYEIYHDLLIHHINPLTSADIYDGSDAILDPNNLITTTQRTHNAIHYGNASSLPRPVVERKAGDTKLW